MRGIAIALSNCLEHTFLLWRQIVGIMHHLVGSESASTIVGQMQRLYKFCKAQVMVGPLDFIISRHVRDILRQYSALVIGPYCAGYHADRTLRT